MINENMHLIEAFKDIFINKNTGILRAANNKIKKSFYFIDGNLVFAHSNLLSEKIGQIMIALGLISKEELETYLSKKPKDTRLGLFLLNQGLITSTELDSALTQQIKKICFNAFNWKSFNLSFEDNPEPIFNDLIINISTPDLIIEGLYQIEEPELLFTKVPNFINCNLMKIENEESHLPRASLSSEETLLLSLIEEKITIRDLLSKSNMPYKDGLLVIYSLFLSGLINFTTEAPTIHTVETSSLLPDLSSEEKINEYIEQIYSKLYKINYYDLLCVEPTDSIAKIQQNYDYFMDKLQPIYYHSDTHKTTKSSLKYIIDYFNEAFDILSNDKERNEYDTKLKEGLIEERPHPDTILQTAEAPIKPEEYSFEIHPVESTQDVKHSIPSKSNAAEEVTSPETSPPPPTDTLKYAEYLFKIKKYKEVLNTLKNIDASHKKQSLYHFLMGASLANYPDKNKEAEEYLLRAYTLEPKNPDYLLHLGLFYKSIGLGIKAFKYLNEVLKIDPNNSAAKEALGLKHSLFDET